MHHGVKSNDSVFVTRCFAPSISMCLNTITRILLIFSRDLQTSLQVMMLLSTLMMTGEFPAQGPVTRKMFPFDYVITSYFFPRYYFVFIWTNNYQCFKYTEYFLIYWPLVKEKKKFSVMWGLWISLFLISTVVLEISRVARKLRRFGAHVTPL